jgi:ADP-ribose pyrophosphatase YjhB (NUDIX family)
MWLPRLDSRAGRVYVEVTREGIQRMIRQIQYRFCPECGRALGARNRGGIDRPHCLHCGLTIHPDPKVAAAGLVIRDGRVLLLERAHPPALGMWCLPGGFVDRGETLEAAVRREVLEETGLEGRAARLYGLYSYPEYPVVVAIYEMTVLDAPVTINQESSRHGWLRPEEIPWDQLAFPSAHDALGAWARTIRRPPEPFLG